MCIRAMAEVLSSSSAVASSSGSRLDDGELRHSRRCTSGFTARTNVLRTSSWLVLFVSRKKRSFIISTAKQLAMAV